MATAGLSGCAGEAVSAAGRRILRILRDIERDAFGSRRCRSYMPRRHQHAIDGRTRRRALSRPIR
eukprot:scaffold242698_cov32-Tisochrysis_lutea.AAC.1